MMRSADVVVIGAGIIGCSAAYFLAADGHRVVIVDRGEVASGTAAASGGWIIIHDKETPAGVALALESRQLYERMAADAGVAGHSFRGGAISLGPPGGGPAGRPGGGGGPRGGGGGIFWWV